MKIDDLPRYIEAPGGGMWKIISSFEISDSENVFVRLADAEKILTRLQQALQDIIVSEEEQSVQSYGLGDIARKALCENQQD